MKITRLPKCDCPICHHTIDAHTALEHEDATPSPGDMSLCGNCFVFLRYTDALQLEHFPDEFIFELPDEIRLVLVRARHHFQSARYNVIGEN